jgi:hypothetical protein
VEVRVEHKDWERLTDKVSIVFAELKSTERSQTRGVLLTNKLAKICLELTILSRGTIAETSKVKCIRDLGVIKKSKMVNRSRQLKWRQVKI